jgi:hydroxylaminobenzene mutase
VIFGAWANWAGTLLSAALRTSKATPISGAGHAGTPIQESLVLGILAATVVAMVIAVGVTAWHLWRGANEAAAPGR